MQRPTPPGRLGATALWLFFTAVTASTLLADVIRGAPLTTGHSLAVAALVAAMAAGHYAWPELRRGAVLTGTALALVFAASTAYVVVSAAARNAETTGQRAAQRAADNDLRAREERQLAQAEAMLAEARRRIAAECASGDGQRCRGARATEAVYAAAIKGHRGTLAEMAPPLPPNGGMAHAARFLAALPGITAAAPAIEERLALTLPVLVVLISELAAIVFGVMSFRSSRLQMPTPHPARGYGERSTRGQPRAITEREEPLTPAEIDDLRRIVAAPEALPPPEQRRPPGGPRRPDRGARSRSEAEADLLTLLAIGQSVPSQAALAARWSRPKQTVSDWLGEWERAGLIPARRQHGRTKSLARA